MADSSWSFLTWIAVIVGFLAVFLAFLLTWKSIERSYCLSPYLKQPLRPAIDLGYLFKEHVYKFMSTFKQYDNRPFRFDKASYCRETGRIFVDSITWYGAIKVDWNFLTKRYPGNYVSWGSLTPETKREIMQCHTPLMGFQTEVSSPTASPRLIEPEFALTTPGPLYVDVETKVILGWKVVPNTSLEVLIVQKPVK